MALVRNKNTGPEMTVRRIVHALGYRYRLHVRSLPGCPDLVFPRRRKVLFVHGCFWHRHDCAMGNRTPKSRVKFWTSKLNGNQERDLAKWAELRRLGWRAMVVWECEIRDRRKLAGRIARFLGPKK